ncbi:MAG: clostripain-related cysteine peptidase [Elusimicrobiota bacterium]
MPILLSFIFFLTSYCGALEIENISLEKIKNEQFQAPKPKMKKWTVAVYMNGKSNIEPFALNDINRFETQGSDENINIVAEIGRSKGLDNDTDEDGDWEGVRRFYILKDEDPKKINSSMIEDLGQIDMGDWKKAAEFLSWAKENYPSEKIMFIIWDHGWGWIDPIKPGENLAGKDRSISHDFVTGNYIKTTDLGKIFKAAGKVDLYASMACFMQMGEVAYEMKDYASVIVGSEEVIQLPSFNFEDLFASLKKNPQANAEKAGEFFTETFKEMYSRPQYQDLLISSKYGTQLSALRGKALDSFASVIKKLAQYIEEKAQEEALAKAKRDVIRFEVGDEITDPEKLISFYGDIYDFVKILAENSSGENKKEVLEIYSLLKNNIEKELIISNVFLNSDRTGKDYSRTHGISLHIPGADGNLIEYHKTYKNLAFEKASGWSRAIKRIEKAGK